MKSTVYDPNEGPIIGPVFAYSMIDAFVVALKYVKLDFVAEEARFALPRIFENETFDLRRRLFWVLPIF